MTSDRINLIIQWLNKNEKLLVSADTIQIQIDIKGNDVKGRVVLLPDSKI